MKIKSKKLGDKLVYEYPCNLDEFLSDNEIHLNCQYDNAYFEYYSDVSENEEYFKTALLKQSNDIALNFFNDLDNDKEFWFQRCAIEMESLCDYDSSLEKHNTEKNSYPADANDYATQLNFNEILGLST